MNQINYKDSFEISALTIWKDNEQYSHPLKLKVLEQHALYRKLYGFLQRLAQMLQGLPLVTISTCT